MTAIDHKTKRDSDFERIKTSNHPRKVVVGGPGTGKSYLFSQLLKKKKNEGKVNFLAITFIGKLSDLLADDLCGLAETVTMHGFARKFVLQECGDDWRYYPNIYEIIKEDLKNEGIEKFEIGDENYKNKTVFYKAVGDDDVVHYAVQICKKDSNKIPKYDLLLIDEFQDFNSVESEFVDELAKKNEIVIVGDDDQALYEFKGSSPAFIRNKYHKSNGYWEKHTLRFCSRCTEVIIKYFHTLVNKYNLNDPAETDPEKRRIAKDFICYAPAGGPDSKIDDSKANPQIHLIKSCPVGMIAYKVQSELEALCKMQKIKDVLIIGEAQTCKSLLNNVAHTLTDYGFKYVNYRDEGLVQLNYPVLDAYKLIYKDNDSHLGWRLLNNPPEEEKPEHIKRANSLGKILNKQSVAESSVEKLIDKINLTTKTDGELKKILIRQQIKHHLKNLPRPLSNLEITVCNILNAKGLGADVVFVIGFDQGRLPQRATPTKSEIYQMLVALTRAKKRIYLINTIGKSISKFIESIDPKDLKTEEIQDKQENKD
jgi:hypothetical protein